MKNLLFIVLFIVFNLVLFAGGHKGTHNDAFEDGTTILNRSSSISTYFSPDALDTSHRVPGLVTWWDYQTNGQNQRQLVVLGDTVIVAVQYSDSVNAQFSSGRSIYYQLSTNGGTTWLTFPIEISPLPLGGAYPDIWPVFMGGFRTITFSGRQFSGGSRGFAGVDIQLGAGSVTTNLIPTVGTDFFSCLLSGNRLGGVYISTDTLFFRKYNYVANTFEPRVLLAVPPFDIDINSRKCIASSTDGQNIFVMWYVSTVGFERLDGKFSTNGGTTFSPPTTVMPTTYVANGDVTTPWFGIDVVYKPNSSVVAAAWCTNTESSVKGYKILSWSPGVNGGNPVVVADRTNMPVLGDTAWVFNSTTNIQTGMFYISHPSLAYSSDGTTLACVYSSVSKDSVFYPGAGETFIMNDIYISYSSNDGASWSVPKKISSCAALSDEIYPVLSKTGNTPTNFGLLYFLSSFPGSSSFTQTTAPTSKNYPIYSRVNPVTGVNFYLTGVSSNGSEIPDRFSLAQNYPNPFNPSTTIRFMLSKSSNVRIKIFDVSGREIESIVNGEVFQAGTHEVNFDASGLASGVYFYSMESGDFRESRKMLLVK